MLCLVMCVLSRLAVLLRLSRFFQLSQASTRTRRGLADRLRSRRPKPRPALTRPPKHTASGASYSGAAVDMRHALAAQDEHIIINHHINHMMFAMSAPHATSLEGSSLRRDVYARRGNIRRYKRPCEPRISSVTSAHARYMDYAHIGPSAICGHGHGISVRVQSECVLV